MYNGIKKGITCTCWFKVHSHVIKDSEYKILTCSSGFIDLKKYESLQKLR